MVSIFSPQTVSPNLRAEVRNLQSDLVEWRRYLHQYPELGFQESKTSAFIADRLSQWGIEHQTGIAETGVVALVRGDLPGPTIGLRADMDALPVTEENDLEYRSRHDNRMHACGHDGHTAIALGTAHLLHQYRSQLRGSVKLIFQPAEERPGGAKPMIAAGVLRDPDVEAMVGLHLWNNLPVGTVGVKGGPSMAYSDEFCLHIFGKGGHGAIPHQTVDAIAIGAQVVTALQTIISRNVNPMEPAVISIGKFHAGNAFNVIAPRAELWGTVRCFSQHMAEWLPQRIEQVVDGICQAHGATYALDYHPLYPAVNNDEGIAELVRQCAIAVLGDVAKTVPEMTMGGEDMSFFLQEVPGCYFFLGSANASAGLNYPHHHPRFNFDEQALGIGVEIFLRAIERYTDSNLS